MKVTTTSEETITVHISDNFDSGNIEVIQADDPLNVRLRIRPDHGSEHFQWFHFRVSGARGIPLRMHIENAGAASYPDGWTHYRACFSYDRKTWQRLAATRYEEPNLLLEHTPEKDAVFFAYFAPYSMERHHDLIAHCLRSPRVRQRVLGRTLDGQDLDLLEVTANGEPPRPNRKRCWIFARQHPGETMAEYLLEGLLGRLLDPADPLARTLLQRADFWIVPNMNPDGSRRGHLRTNACGSNLNREWAEPTMERSPEVFLVRQEMLRSGADFALDVHGDEGLPYNFIAGPDGVKTVTAARRTLESRFKDELIAANPDFQREVGYPSPPLGQANMTMATNWIADALGALSMTLEMPFKDNLNAPDDSYGWSPARCKKLGSGVLDALFRIVDTL